MRSLLTAILLALCAFGLDAKGVLDTVSRDGTVLPGFREDSVRARMSAAPLHDVEGLWEVAGEGSLMAVERISSSPDLYVMAVVRGTDSALRPGTVMGYLTPGAARGEFDARIYTSFTDEGTPPRAPTDTRPGLTTRGFSSVSGHTGVCSGLTGGVCCCHICTARSSLRSNVPRGVPRGSAVSIRRRRGRSIRGICDEVGLCRSDVRRLCMCVCR